MQYSALLLLTLVSVLGVQSLDCPQSSISCVESFTKSVSRLLKNRIRREVERYVGENFDMPEELKPELENALGLVLNDVEFALQEFPERAYLGLPGLDQSEKNAADVLEDKYPRWVKNLAVVHTEIEPEICRSDSMKITGLVFGLMMGQLARDAGTQSLAMLNERSRTCFQVAEP